MSSTAAPLRLTQQSRQLLPLLRRPVTTCASPRLTSPSSILPRKQHLPPPHTLHIEISRRAMSTSDTPHKDGNNNWASKDGQFRRQESAFRESIKEGGKHPPAVGRYKLFVSLACPWAHRALIVRKLKGMDQVEGLLPVYVVDTLLGPEGWAFESYDKTHPDLAGFGKPGSGLVPGHEDKKRIRDFYLQADPQYSARCTVPVIWDEELKTVVSNESADIIRNLNNCFDSLIPEQYRGVTYYPERLREGIDSVNPWIYDQVNNGVYKSGFATTQQAYESNVVPLFEALDRIEALLEKNSSGYLVGDTLTEADIRLYTTIVRFDPVYHGHFKCNLSTIRSGYPRINAWLKKLYWDKSHDGRAFRDTTDFEHIKWHYYASHAQINPTRIVPAGPKHNVEPL